MTRTERLERTREAGRFMTHLSIGDRVVVGTDGREYVMTVARLRHSDGQYGSWESYGPVVTLGPGRWSTKIDAESVAAGRFTIRMATDEEMPA